MKPTSLTPRPAVNLPAILSLSLLLCTCLACADGVGWRTDGTGRYPDSAPVIEWAADTNIVWATELPATANSTPVVVGDRICVTAEPASLLCLDRGDGAILWQAANEYTDIAPPEQLADMEQKQAEYDQLLKEIGQTNRERNKVRKQLQDDPDNEALKTQMQQLNTTVRDLQSRLQPYLDVWYVRPVAHETNGYASATPVTDGAHVWALFGTGVGCCYDLEGNRVWARSVGKPRNGYGHSASPILADGKVIMHVTSLQALEPLTGELIWEAPVPACWGTSIVTEIEGTPVVLTPNGYMVNATDGTVLAEKLANCTYASPVLHDGVVYFADEKGWAAFTLPETLDPFEPRQLWQANPKKDRYYGSPVIHEGIIYGVTQAQILSAMDAATGELLYEQNLTMGRGVCYPSITLAGESLLLGCDNGTTVVFEPGETYQEVARNTLEPYRGSPVLVGDLLYLRGLEHMYCIGAQ